MTPPTIDIDVFDSLRNAVGFCTHLWAEQPADAWIYGILVGWGDSLPSIAARHCWTEEDTNRLRVLRAVFELVEENARLDWSMMARAMERAGVPPTMVRTPDGAINNCAIAAGYDERECQVCGGACPDRGRYER